MKAIRKSKRTRPTGLPKYDKFLFKRLFDKVRDIGRQRITSAGSFCRLTLYIDGSDSECFGSRHQWQARALARLELIFRTRPKAYRVDQKCHRETQTHVHLSDATRRKPGPMSRATLHLERIRAISRVARQLRYVHPPAPSPFSSSTSFSFLLFLFIASPPVPPIFLTFHRSLARPANFSRVSLIIPRVSQSSSARAIAFPEIPTILPTFSECLPRSVWCSHLVSRFRCYFWGLILK